MRNTSVVVIDGESGRSRSALASVRLLGRAGRTVHLARPGDRQLEKAGMAAASRWVSSCHRLPPVSDHRAFVEAVEDLVVVLGRPPVVATSDAAALALGLAPPELVSKREQAELARQAGLDVPRSEVATEPAEIATAVAALGGRAVVKPFISTHPARMIVGAQLAAGLDPGSLVHGGPVLVQEVVDGDLTAVGGVMGHGRLRAVVHQRALRTWPPVTGTSSAAITVDPDERREAALARLLHSYNGVFQAQFIGRYLIDLNLRAYGSLPLAAAAGVDLLAHAVEVATGDDADRPPTIERARPGVRYRWLDGDLRAIAWSVRHRRLGPVAAGWHLLPRPGTAHSVWDRRDVRPFVVRARQLLERS